MPAGAARSGRNKDYCIWAGQFARDKRCFRLEVGAIQSGSDLRGALTGRRAALL